MLRTDSCTAQSLKRPKEKNRKCAGADKVDDKKKGGKRQAEMAQGHFAASLRPFANLSRLERLRAEASWSPFRLCAAKQPNAFADG